MEWDDEKLRRFREGNPEALAAVYRANAEGLARMLRAAAWRGGVFSHLRGAMELENLILETIARNVLLEQSRNRELAVGLEPFEGQGEVPEDNGGLAQALEDREVEALVAGFKEGLSTEERRLFELRFGEGLAQETAASQMGLTRIQVRRREHGIKTRLLGFLQARGYLEGLETRGWSFFRRRGDS
jgi:RNA polymerase sigma-70 factor, ECF subfamily